MAGQHGQFVIGMLQFLQKYTFYFQTDLALTHFQTVGKGVQDREMAQRLKVCL